jgi:hypothetical protein
VPEERIGERLEDPRRTDRRAVEEALAIRRYQRVVDRPFDRDVCRQRTGRAREHHAARCSVRRRYYYKDARSYPHHRKRYHCP